jgi:hypothetical protein
METGAPFFFADLGVGVEVSVGCGAWLSLGVGVSVPDGVGEILRRFLADGVTDSSGVGVGENSVRRFGDADGLPSGISDPSAPGELLTAGFRDGAGDGDPAFFLADAVFRCLCGVGVGVGRKTFLILSPIDSSAGSPTVAKMKTAGITANNDPLSLMGHDQPASSCKTALFIRMPAPRFSSGKFSLGE